MAAGFEDDTGYEDQNFTKANVERIRRETDEMIQRMQALRPRPIRVIRVFRGQKPDRRGKQPAHSLGRPLRAALRSKRANK